MSSGHKRDTELCNSYGRGVDVYVPTGKDVEVPLCPHGPTLLFERFVSNGSSKKFFACSACRDRKDCPFFMWEDDKMTEGKRIIQEHTKRTISERINNLSYDLISSLRKQDKQLIFCHTCDTLATEYDGVHKEHNTRKVAKEDSANPTRILLPLVNKKLNAQFLFSEKTLGFITDFVKKLGYSKVLCIGTPTFHEVFRRSSNGPNSLLLDIDHRHAQFNTKETYSYYNMFNNYFFDPDSKEIYLRFLKVVSKDDLVIIIDPPFGGLMSLIGETVNSIWKDWRAVNEHGEEDCPATVLAFPYFLESHVTKAVPSLLMTDYKVIYHNHKSYKEQGSKKGSPVRLFTNIPLSSFVLPKKEGYKNCTKCQRYVAAENRHCEECNSCTSKDGSTYVHCDFCKTCVKPERKHCPDCNKCETANHKCGEDRQMVGCHICGELGHKRKDCPERNKHGTGQPGKRAKRTH